MSEIFCPPPILIPAYIQDSRRTIMMRWTTRTRDGETWVSLDDKLWMTSNTTTSIRRSI